MDWSPWRLLETAGFKYGCKSAGLRLCFTLIRLWFDHPRALLLYFQHPLSNTLLHAFIRRLIVAAVFQVIGQALHVRDFVFDIVRVLVSLAISQVFHQSC